MRVYHQLWNAPSAGIWVEKEPGKETEMDYPVTYEKKTIPFLQLLRYMDLENRRKVRKTEVLSGKRNMSDDKDADFDNGNSID